MFDLQALIRKLFPTLPHHAAAGAGDHAAPEERAVRAQFSDCADFNARTILCGGRADAPITVCWLDGVVSGTDVAETVLRPLAESEALARAADAAQRARLIEGGAVYCSSLKRRETLTDAVDDLTHGRCVLLLDGAALSFEARTQEHRPVSEPTINKSVLGARDAFTETYRVNTSLVRRRLCTPELKLTELRIGRRSATQTGVFYLAGIARQEVVDDVLARLRAIDIDGVTALGDLEEPLASKPRAAFPQLLYTERPDRFARSLLEGRVGVLTDGLPLGLVTPCTLPELLRVEEDRSLHAAAATGLVLLRWAALLLALLLPALYVAVAMYHQEMIPYKLLQSVIEAKQHVPFSTGAEIVGMLLCFGLLQEAGLRLPDAAGTAVSIIGTLIVGQSAVEARVVSPIAVIVVALSGIAGYTQPNQHLGAAIRLWRFVLLAFALLLGAYGVAAGIVLLLWRLCCMDSSGVAYLYPLVEGERGRLVKTFLRPPLRMNKARDEALRGRNRRRQA